MTRALAAWDEAPGSGEALPPLPLAIAFLATILKGKSWYSYIVSEELGLRIVCGFSVAT